MNTFVENLKSLSSSQIKPKLEGRWMGVQMKPDFASGETLNIGTVFYGKNCFSYKLLDEFKRIRSIYGEAAEDEFRFLVESLKTSFRRHQLESPAVNISFTHPKYAAGEDPEEIVSKIFSTTVPLSKPKAAKENFKRSFAKNNTYVRSKVFSSIKRQAKLFADNVIADPSPYLLNEHDRSIALDIPLRSKNQLGSIVSAAFFQRESVELSFFRAWMDLITARTLAGKKQLGLFVFYPSDRNYWPSEAKHTEAGNVIDLFQWRLGRQNIATSVSDNPDDVAKDIIDWAEIS